MLSCIRLIVIWISLIQIQGTVWKRFDQSLVRLRVEKQQVCANQGDTVTLRCTLFVRNTNKASEKWSVQWYSEGKRLTQNITEEWQNSTQLTSVLRLKTFWSGEKLFTCEASRFASDAQPLLNSSTLVKVKTPTPCDIIGFRNIEELPHNTIEAYWRPPETTTEDVVYSLNLCKEPDYLGSKNACPHYNTFNSSCFHMKKDLYGLPSTKGFICTTRMQASWRLGFLGVSGYHKAYISRRVNGENCEYRCSDIKQLYITEFSFGPSEPNTITLVMIPVPIATLRVITRASREVSLIRLQGPVVRRVHSAIDRMVTFFKLLKPI